MKFLKPYKRENLCISPTPKRDFKRKGISKSTFAHLKLDKVRSKQRFDPPVNFSNNITSGRKCFRHEEYKSIYSFIHFQKYEYLLQKSSEILFRIHFQRIRLTPPGCLDKRCLSRTLSHKSAIYQYFFEYRTLHSLPSSNAIKYWQQAMFGGA